MGEVGRAIRRRCRTERGLEEAEASGEPEEDGEEERGVLLRPADVAVAARQRGRWGGWESAVEGVIPRTRSSCAC